MKKQRKEKKEAKDSKKINFISIFFRYIILVLLAFKSLYLFYFIFFYLTAYPLLLLLSPFYSVSIYGNILVVESVGIELVNACIAGSAYYLLLILNLTTPMKTKKRVNAIVFSFLSLLIINIIRIFVFTILFLNNFSLFDVAHKIFWNALSTVFVVGIWFLTAKLFKIHEIPVYSDFKNLLGAAKKQIKKA